MTTVVIKGLKCTNDAQGNRSPPADRHPASPSSEKPCSPHFPVPKLDGTSHGMEYTVGQFGSGALAGHEKLKNP